MARRGFSQWGNDLHTGRRSYNIVGRRKGFFAVSLVIVALCALVLGIRGFNFGIEFTGGSEFTVSGVSDTSQSIATEVVEKTGVTEIPRVSSLGSSAVRVQTVPLEQAQIDEIKAGLAEAYGVGADAVTVTTIGATWGKDVSSKTIQGLIVFVLLVTLVMTAYFRNWRMAAGTYSSIFLATPIEVALRDREPAIKAHTEKVLALRAGAEAGEPDAAYAVTGKLLPGQHQGHAAQPRRRKK